MYTEYAVDTVYTVCTLYTVYKLYTLYRLYTVYTLYALYTMYTLPPVPVLGWFTTRLLLGCWPRAVSQAVPKRNPHRLASRVASSSPHHVRNGTYVMPMVIARSTSWGR